MKDVNQISIEKKIIRQIIFQKKREFGENILQAKSLQIISKLENSIEFKTAQHILAYHSLPFEVVTSDAIERWNLTKTVYLPTVVGDQLKIKKYSGKESLTKGSFDVWEPVGEIISNLDTIDLVIIPGVAFDRNKRRIGYGKGFYDKFLPQLKAKKVGICFDFQLFEQIPTNDFDQLVDLLFTEQQIVL
ncbi:MAG: 5-formyltetrahydrofolate cyclo-ligase [Bacteroidales bacterium]|nr:5-formyltetrahydrofolate cyclo-ligase [Bacteroidales bacterium]